MFIRVIFSNIITYLDRTFKKEQNDINDMFFNNESYIGLLVK
jgi:hypothetical protein